MSSFAANPAVIAALLRNAPTLDRLALGMHDERLRAKAADDLADYVVRHLDDPVPVRDANQLVLPL